MTILLLGGTAESRQLATLLLADGLDVVTSLAGDVAELKLPPGPVRVGGFGGVPGLVSYLNDQQIHAVVNATHPFAAQMSAHAATACAAADVPLLRLSRPSWAQRPDADSWHWVDSLAEAKAVAEDLGERVFLAIGRQGLAEFTGWTDRYVLARVVDPPDVEVPSIWEVLRARGPFRLADELDLLHSRRIDVLVTKDSGGATSAKLDAAAELGTAVIIVARPATPEGVPIVPDIASAAAWVRRLARLS